MPHEIRAWHCKMEDEAAFFRALADGKISKGLVEINWGVINRIAQAEKGQIMIPGIKAVEELVIVSGGGR